MLRCEFLQLDNVLELHDEMIELFGGDLGVRDLGLIESAVAAPINHANYADHPTLVEIAACYAYSISKNHGFVDGNKRTAFAACQVFLSINGHAIEADEIDVVNAMVQIAEDELDREGFAVWLAERVRESG